MADGTAINDVETIRASLTECARQLLEASFEYDRLAVENRYLHGRNMMRTGARMTFDDFTYDYGDIVRVSTPDGMFEGCIIDFMVSGYDGNEFDKVQLKTADGNVSIRLDNVDSAALISGV